MLLNKFLFPYDAAKEEKLLDHQVLIVSVFGKTSYLSNSCKADILDTLLGYNIFRKSMLDDPEIRQEILGNIEGFYNKRENVIYLHLLGSFDTHSLLKIYEQYSAQLEEKGFLTLWTDLKFKYARSLLFLFLVSHILVVCYPTHVFDLSLVQLFKAIEHTRSKIADDVTEILRTVDDISTDWLNNARFCSPRVLFYFETCPVALKNIEDSQVLANLKKLEHAMEDQIYRILRKSRIITNTSRTSLFAIPVNQEFVFIETEQNSMKEWTSFYLSSLISFYSNSNSENNHCRPSYGFESLPESVVMPTASDAHTFSVFLHNHIETGFTKGFDDNFGRHSMTNLFEIPTAGIWFEAANKLFQFLIMNDDEGETISSGVIHLKTYLDFDQRFSEARCNKVFPLAIATYQENLPTHYTKKYHETKVSHALSVFGIHARGPQVDMYVQKLIKECEKYWKNGRQMCEVLSLTGNPCNLPLHKPLSAEHTINDQNENSNSSTTNLNELEHSSGVRYISACNCGRKQGPRDDPFSIRVANYEFYQVLGDECGCSHFDKIIFPVFQPSTKDFRAAQLFTKPTKIAGRKDHINSLLVPKEFGQETQGHTQGLSLGFMSNHSISMTGDILLADGANGINPVERINDTNNQIIKPSQASLTQTTDNIVIHVTDHCDDKGLVRQPSTTEYLPGMLHTESPPSLLPQFPSWSLVCLGPSSLYSHNLGLQEQHHPGFLSGSGYLLPWDVTVRLEHHAKERYWSASDTRSKNSGQRNRKKGTKEFNVKIFIGVEYECPCGHRFMCSSPDKVLKATGSGLVRDNGSKVTNCDMPLYFPCPCRNSKQLIAQLMRIHVVTPKAPVNVTLNPRVQPAPNLCPIFVTGIQEPVRLSQSSYWILRLPYVYYGDRGPYLPLKDHLPSNYGRLLSGLYGISEVPADSK